MMSLYQKNVCQYQNKRCVAQNQSIILLQNFIMKSFYLFYCLPQLKTQNPSHYCSFFKHVFLRIYIFKMLQNKVRKELSQIESQLDEEMAKIDRLLQLLSQNKGKVQHLSSKSITKMKTQWSEGEFDLTGEQQLNQTCEQTEYNSSGMGLVYNFQCFWEHCQEILLDNYNQYDSRYIRQFTLKQPKRMEASTKSNWIANYLDEGDTTVTFELQKSKNIIKDIANGLISYTEYDVGSSQTKLIESQQIYSMASLQIQFPQHMTGYQLNLQVGSKDVLYEITILQKCRILIQCPNQQEELIRYLIVKTQGEENSIIWGAYSRQTIFQSLILEAGTYILLPLPGGNACNLYFKSSSVLTLKKDYAHSLKSFNLLKNTFEQCQQFANSTTSSFRIDEQSIKKEYTRSCYMNFGIVLEIYENIYQHEARFIDQSNCQQDIKLLFEQIYTSDQIDNRFSPGERIIKFYAITEKPANLFIPDKKVLMGNQYMENQVYHAIFK